MTTPETVPVTDEDRIAYFAFNHLPSKYRETILAGEWDDVAGMQIIARHRLASIEAACREKDAEIARLQAANIDIGYDLRRVKAERDHLRAKLDEANEIIAALLDIKHGDEKEMERAFKVAFSEAIKKVGMETFKRSSFFGSNDSDRGEPVAQFRKVGCSDWYDGYPDHDDGGDPYETRTLYAHPTHRKARAMSYLVEQCRDAFDSDNPAYKNLALRKCADRIEALERELAAAKEKEARLREALDIADRLIERGYGIDVPPEWDRAFRRCLPHSAALSDG